MWRGSTRRISCDGMGWGLGVGEDRGGGGGKRERLLGVVCGKRGEIRDGDAGCWMLDGWMDVVHKHSARTESHPTMMTKG